MLFQCFQIGEGNNHPVALHIGIIEQLQAVEIDFLVAACALVIIRFALHGNRCAVFAVLQNFGSGDESIHEFIDFIGSKLRTNLRNDTVIAAVIADRSNLIPEFT